MSGLTRDGLAPQATGDEPELLGEDEVIALLEPGGGIAGRLAGYEHRPQQLQMLAAVIAAFNEETTLTVEAGTGTGKSLAYLLPAILWSRRNGERVIVSTHTINLQEQIVRKDLPFLTRQAGLECDTVLVKGRGNYLCRRKAAQAEAQGRHLIEDDHLRQLSDVLAWAKRTTDGSLADLPVRPRTEVWEQVASESDNCLGARCPFFADCFFYRARRAAANADIVVANHHLLMADLALREEIGSYTQNAVLPPARRVIVDEAHHLEDVATNYFGTRLGYVAIERAFGRLRSSKQETRGALPALVVALKSIEAAEDQAPAEGAVQWIEERLLPQRASLLVDAEQCFSELLEGLEEVLERPIAAGREEKVRVVDDLRALPYWNRLEEWLGRLGAAFGRFAGEFEGVCERLEALSDESAKRVLSLNTELRAMQSRIAGFAAALVEFTGDDENACRWLEARQRPRTGGSLALCTAPITVAPLLRRALFERFPTVVLTSATLAVDRRFDYLHAHLGLDGLSDRERVSELRVESPFDFARQALLAIPKDLPEPNSPAYEPAMHETISDVLAASGGGTFVLFTAYGALRRAVAALAPSLEARGLNILRQGDANRHLLLERFAANPRSVLFATDSFWEGVDVPGDSLRCVIIARLPFRVPTEPIEQARVDAITARGGNAFSEHTVPQAVIKLKQGFGRLIRSRTDRGSVVLLDSRVVSKRYGHAFLDSLPPARRLIAEKEAVCSELHEFFSPRCNDAAAQRRKGARPG